MFAGTDTKAIILLLLAFNNYRYALDKYKKRTFISCLDAALIIPCKNLDANFEQNISSFYRQDYEDYFLWFVVGRYRGPRLWGVMRAEGKIERTHKRQRCSDSCCRSQLRRAARRFIICFMLIGRSPGY